MTTTTAYDLLNEIGPAWAPMPPMTVSQWADKYRRLSSEASAIPGRWSTSRVEYMREPMDLVGSRGSVSSIAIVAAAQIGKSEFILNIAGYLIDYDPSPILLIQPTLDNAEAFSKDRVAPMIRDTPVLRNKVNDAKSRDGDNTIKQKKFPGGHLTLIGANSPSGLASRPIRAVLADEVDKYPVSAGTEGDPLLLADKRTTTFWNRIKLRVSTPAVENDSRIMDAYEEGDERQYWVPCKDCDEHQILVWANVTWDARDASTAHYTCEHCGSVWDDVDRNVAVRNGHWRAQKPFNGKASFHITGLMSPFVTMQEAVQEFLEALGDPEKMQVFTNAYLGEPWQERGEQIDHHALYERREEYEDQIPDDVVLLTAGVDVQDQYLEYEILGWGEFDETWSIKTGKIMGETSDNAVWQELKSVIFQIFVHPRFGEMSVRACCLDSGYQTKKVYEFVKKTERIYAIKGIGGEGKPIVGNPSKNNWAKVPVFPVGSFTVKETVTNRLNAEPGEAGYSHFPIDDNYNDEYFKQMTAETPIIKFHKGYKKREWVKLRRRNEAFDNRCYATAAVELLDVDLSAIRRYMEVQYEREQAAEKVETKPTQSSRKTSTGFVDNWRNR